MYTGEMLADLHQRGHRSFGKLVEHCGRLDVAQADREIAGFGYPSVRLQLIHAIGAEAYWVSVLQGRMDAEDRDGVLRTIASVADWRAAVAAATQAYLRTATPHELDTARPMTTFGGKSRELVPARVVLRTVTHLYHHQGQVVAMCRLLGSPVSSPASGMDFPLD